MVTVARGLHKTTIAECVEDEETLLMLKGFGVDCVQGYYLEKPRADHPLLAAASRLQSQNANLELRLT
jgi:EAL domain-containing protein (putative c-di-GMP-specific phosphodiesterase class I)